MKKLLLIILMVTIAFAVFFTACSKKSSTNGGSTDPAGLIGIWNAISGAISFVLKTNSNQTAVDLFGEGTGSMSLTGEVNTTLTYILAAETGSGVAIAISNQPYLL